MGVAHTVPNGGDPGWLPPLVVMGGGNMGGALLRAVLARGAGPDAVIGVAEPDGDRRRSFGGAGVATAAGIGELLAGLAPRLRGASGPLHVLLAVKPQLLAPAAGELVRALRTLGGGEPSPVVISILAGVPLDRLGRALEGSGRAVRAMPNLPASVGRGLTALAPAPGLSEAELGGVERVLACAGEVIRIPEALMDAFTALAGSGPAYVCYLAEGLLRGARAAGFDEADAQRIVRATIAGSGELLASDPRTPAELRRAVTSPGGTTSAACNVLDRAGVDVALEAAVVAGRDRARELGAG